MKNIKNLMLAAFVMICSVNNIFGTNITYTNKANTSVILSVTWKNGANDTNTLAPNQSWAKNINTTASTLKYVIKPYDKKSKIKPYTESNVTGAGIQSCSIVNNNGQLGLQY